MLSILEDYKVLLLGWLTPVLKGAQRRNKDSYDIKPGLPGSPDICQMLLLHNQATSTESAIIGSGHTTRFAHVKSCPYKTDNTEDIRPNIVPVSVFLKMGGRAG